MNYKESIYKLQTGINNLDALDFKIVYNQNQFYSEEKRRPINMYSIKFVQYNEDRQKNDYTEVFKSATQIFVVFFLRNLWFTLKGQEIPKTQFPQFENMWNTFMDEYEIKALK